MSDKYCNYCLNRALCENACADYNDYLADMGELSLYKSASLTPDEVRGLADAKAEGRILPVSPFGTYQGEKVKLVAAASNGNIVIEGWVRDGKGAYSRHILTRAEAEAVIAAQKEK